MPVSVPLSNGDTIEVRIVSQLNEQVSYNVRHYFMSGSEGAGSDLGTFLSEFSQLIEANYKALMTDGATFLGVDGRRIHPTPSVTLQFTDDSGPGTAGTEALPRQTSGLISFLSDQPGSRGRGRMYVPFPDIIDNDGDGQPGSGYNTTLDQLATKMGQIISVGVTPDVINANPAVWSRVAQSSFLADAVVARRGWATQRSRGTYGRPNANPF